MNVIFIHQSAPGQFRHLIAHLAATGGHRVVCIGRRNGFAPPGVGRVSYDLPDTALPAMNPFLSPLDQAVRHGLQVARACEALVAQGFRPDLIVGHPGWGETLYVKQIFPQVPLLLYCEFFYRAFGADTNFDPADQQDLLTNCATETRNAPLLLSLDACDWAIAPTAWQKQVHPRAYHDRISVRFDGIDTDAAAPDPAARFVLPDGRELRHGDPVVTYVARSLEPYRGFPTFMRALPEVLRRVPRAQVVVLGADAVSYGKPPPDGGSWRETMLAEVAPDPARVHFLGQVPRDDYLRLLRASAVHVYLTVPFVLSWSMLEAMASGCVVVGSDTPPVREVIEPGGNGLLVDFFDAGTLAAQVVDVLERRAAMTAMRQAARWTALSRYALARCLPRQLDLLEALARRERPSLD